MVTRTILMFFPGLPIQSIREDSRLPIAASFIDWIVDWIAAFSIDWIVDWIASMFIEWFAIDFFLFLDFFFSFST